MKIRNQTFIHFAIMALVYIALQLWRLPSGNISPNYHISTTEQHLISLIIVAPLLVIWLLALYGQSWMRGYVKSIKQASEHRAFASLAVGLTILAYGLPLSSIISSALNHISNFSAGSIIINNYVSIIYLLATLIFIAAGARGLADGVKARPSQAMVQKLGIVLVAVGVVYSYFIFRDKPANLDAIYHLPMWLIVLTIVIPYIYTWFVGLLGLMEILLYTQKLRGIIYRQSWYWLAGGLGLIIFMDIALQILRSLSNIFHVLSFSNFLLIIFIVLIVIAVGFSMIAYGAKKLLDIEKA